MAMLSFLERRARAIAVVLVLIASARIVATYKVFNHTFDEPVHVACGMEWLDKGKYTYEPQHPPLARVAGALGPFLMGIRSPGLASRDPFARAVEGIDILYSGHHYDRTLALARLGVLPFFWIACAVVYLWGVRYFSKALAAIAVFFFSFEPTVLAHAGLATTDMALTALLGASFLTGLIWVERPTKAHAAWFGAATGLAVLSKLSTLAFFPAAVVVTLAWYWAIGQSLTGKAIRKRIPTFALAIGIGALTIWAGYRFSFGHVDFAGTSLPAPELYAGIQAVMTHESVGHWSYLLGQRSPLGFWYFYPVALAVKTPLAFLALLAWGVVLAFRRDPQRRILSIPLAFSAAVLQVGMLGHINIGIRHILPVYIGFSILAAAALVKLIETATGSAGGLDAGNRAVGKTAGAKKKPVGFLVAVLLIWLAGSSLLSHPDYIAYFNELAGSEPEKILVDSDLDWGQDIKRLSRRLHELGAAEVTFPQFIVADLEKEHGFPKVNQTADFHHPPQGYFAAGATFWKALRFGLSPDEDANIWPDQVQPTERIGRGMFLWRFEGRAGAFACQHSGISLAGESACPTTGATLRSKFF
ncbi:MAG TPA: glycosyl transferase [Bryobacteraceae bacterium]|nr:glycosyl transferase [Bryobacteraceae bacterium]